MKTLKSIKKTKSRKIKKNKTKKRGHLKYHKRINLKTGGDGDKLTIMTFNVEVFLELYDYNKDTREATEIADKIASFGTLFDSIDVACLQETVSTRSADRKFPDPVPELKEVSICKSHELTWDKSKALYGEDSYLSNSIYVKPEIVQNPESNQHTTISTVGDQRCYASTTINLNGKPITIASVHIIGGRFDDKKALENDDNIDEKIRQINAAISSNADIICGDFNTKIRVDTVVADTDRYFESIFVELGVDISLKDEYKARWDKWIYMDNYHRLLTEAGYKSAYYSDDGTLIKSIADTSAFGGIVDMIYYKSTSLKLDGVPEIVGVDTVMNGPESYFKHKPILSDHYPVKARFTLV